MATEEFLALVSQVEGESLDFKETGYDLSSNKGRNDFTLDLLALANTPRNGTAYIVLGVRWSPESGLSIIGLDRQIDDVDFQDAIGDGRISPRPRFSYIPLSYEGKRVGIIHIPADKSGPYTPTKDFSGPPSLQAGAIYFRSGTQNKRATGEQIKRIVGWFTGGSEATEPPTRTNSWRDFLGAVHSFTSGRLYILAADHIKDEASVPIASTRSTALASRS